MPIRMVLIEGRSVPAVFCDHCKQRIQKAREGNIEWASEDNADVLFSHKECSDPLRAKRPYITASMELAYFPIRLTYGLEIDVEKAHDAIEALADFS